MATRTRLIAVLVLILAALPLAAPSTPVATASRSNTITNPDAGPPGIYVFYDWYKLDPKKYPIVGGEMTFTWKSIETSQGKYNWGGVDQFLSEIAKQGKRAALRINSYDGQCCGGSRVPDFYKTSTPKIIIKCGSAEIPRYWDSAYKTPFGNLIKAFGARYNKDSRVAWIEISSGIYGETAPAEDEYDACLQSAGLSSDLWVSTVNWSTDLYRQAFPDKQTFLQYAPRFLNRTERELFSNYAAGKGVGLKHNGLKADGGADMYITDPTSPDYDAGQYDPLAMWGDKVPMAFEGASCIGCMEDRTNTMWGIYNSLDKHSDFLALESKVITPTDRLDLLQFAAKYLGKKVPDIPSAWVAMRETELGWFPDYGNYEFYLFQNDAAPGGKSVPLWKYDSTPEGRYTRRTDQASGNPHMYFDIDNQYAYGGLYNATITVTYKDKGTDRWELRYDSTSAPDKLAGTITKKNTNTWQKAVFQLTDAGFGDRMAGGGSRQGSDFRISSLNDGDEIIHMVDVVATPGKPKTLRLQPGVDGYDGLKESYLDSWNPDKAHGTEEKMWTAHPDQMFPVMRWDLSSLPAGARVVTATMGLYQYNSAPTYAVQETLTAHRLLRSWDENTTTWNRATSSTSWEKPGAMGASDRETAASGSVVVNQVEGWAQINITPLLQLWSETPSTNLGLLLKSAADRNSQFYWRTSEFGTVNQRPWLEIQYYESVKPPATWTPTSTPKPGTATNTPTPTRTTAVTATATPTRTNTPTVTPTPTATVGVRSLVSRFAASSPAIDGSLSEWTQPDLIVLKAGTADSITFQANPSPDDLSTEVRSFWDAKYLYVGASVTDDKLYSDSTSIWDDDSIEIGIDGANDQAAYGPDDHQFTISVDGRIADYGTLLATDVRATFQVSTRQRTGGYDVELAIPLTYLNAGGFSEGKQLGFTVGLNDDDDGGKRDSAVDNHMVWEGTSTNSAPAEWGKLVLGSTFQLITPTPTRTATSGPTATATATRTATPTSTTTNTPSPTATPTATNTPSPTATATATKTATPTPTDSATPSATVTPSRTPTASQTPTASPTKTYTPTPTSTSTWTPSPTPSNTPTATATGAARVTGRVWLDRNGNGRADTGEPGVGGIQLTLVGELVDGGATTPVDSVCYTVTGGAGTFQFGGLHPGHYIVALVDVPNLQATTERKRPVELPAGVLSVEVVFGVRGAPAPARTFLPLIMQR